MNQSKNNKEFIIRYVNAISGEVKTRELCAKYIADESLTEHILFFDTVFPRYEMLIDELTGDGNRVVLRGRVNGKHEGAFNGIPPTQKEIVLPFVIGYEIEDNMIISHWLLADQVALMEQLGVMSPAPQ
jgi:predicted ester cyclase